MNLGMYALEILQKELNNLVASLRQNQLDQTNLETFSYQMELSIKDFNDYINERNEKYLKIKAISENKDTTNGATLNYLEYAEELLFTKFWTAQRQIEEIREKIRKEAEDIAEKIARIKSDIVEYDAEIEYRKERAKQAAISSSYSTPKPQPGPSPSGTASSKTNNSSKIRG